MKYVISVVLVSLLCLNAAFAVNIADCGSKLGRFTSVHLDGCSDSRAECELVRNTTVGIEITFDLDVDVEKVVVVIYGIINNAAFPFPIPFADACADDNSGITCPLEKGSGLQYRTSLPVLRTYPKLSVKVQWELKNEEGENIICALIPSRIK